jgi:hypothetical protein
MKDLKLAPMLCKPLLPVRHELEQLSMRSQQKKLKYLNRWADRSEPIEREKPQVTSLIRTIPRKTAVLAEKHGVLRPLMAVPLPNMACFVAANLILLQLPVVFPPLVKLGLFPPEFCPKF